MKLLGLLFLCFCLDKFFPGVLCAPSLRDKGTSPSLPFSEVQASERSPSLLVLPKENGQGPHAALFKLLSGHDTQGLESDVSRPPPDSRALQYMKNLYEMFATEEGVLKANKRHLYNTVRLVSPHAQCKHPTTNGDLHSIDLFFNLDYVTASEHLLKSALLLFDESVSTASNLTCVCNVVVQESDASTQVCIDVPHAMVFNLHFELGSKWMEIDVTTILHPWIVIKKRNLHMTVNFTCLKNEPSPNSEYDFFNTAQRSLFLLFYTVDMSEHTYHKWNFFRRNLTPSSLKKGPFTIPFTIPSEEAKKGLKQGRAPRRRREDGKMKNTPVPIFNISQYYKQFTFPQNECELHSFWLEFSQLNWDKWIIAPHRYDPHYCKGDCPRVVGHRYGSPKHAIIQKLMREKLDSSVPELSCIPADYSPLSVLKVEADRSIVYQEYQNMIAKTCTCR